MRQRLHPEQKFSQSENHPSHGWLQKKSIDQDSETDDEMDTPGVYKGPGLSRNLEGSAKLPFTDYSHLKPDPSDFIRESIQQRLSTPPIQAKSNIGETDNQEPTLSRSLGDKSEGSAKIPFTDYSHLKPDPSDFIRESIQQRFSTQPIQAKNSKEEINNQSEQETEIVQQKRENGESIEAQKEISPNRTGLPDHLKTGVENLSGYSLDDVRVHYNSPKPAQLQAHAYTQGTEIHVASGQEQHLPHETWHVVQQKQGRVKPTMQMKGNVNVNDNVGLEKEADFMGEKARLLRYSNQNMTGSQFKGQGGTRLSPSHQFGVGVAPVQCYWWRTEQGEIVWKGDKDYHPLDSQLPVGNIRKVKGLKRWKYKWLLSFLGNVQLPVYERFVEEKPEQKVSDPPAKRFERRGIRGSGANSYSNYFIPVPDEKKQSIQDLTKQEIKYVIATAKGMIKRKKGWSDEEYAQELLNRDIKRKYDCTSDDESRLLQFITQFVKEPEEEKEIEGSGVQISFRPLTGLRVDPANVEGYENLPEKDQERVRERLKDHNNGVRSFNYHRGIGGHPTMDLANLYGGGGGGGRGDYRLQFYEPGKAKIVNHKGKKI